MVPFLIFISMVFILCTHTIFKQYYAITAVKQIWKSSIVLLITIEKYFTRRLGISKTKTVKRNSKCNLSRAVFLR